MMTDIILSPRIIQVSINYMSPSPLPKCFSKRTKKEKGICVMTKVKYPLMTWLKC